MKNIHKEINFLEEQVKEKEKQIHKKTTRYSETEPLVLLEEYTKKAKKLSLKTLGFGILGAMGLLILSNIVVFGLVGITSNFLTSFINGLLCGFTGYGISYLAHYYKRKKLHKDLSKETNEHFDILKDIIVLNGEMNLLKEELLRKKNEVVLNLREETKLIPATIEKLQSQKLLPKQEEEEVVDTELNFD